MGRRVELNLFLLGFAARVRRSVTPRTAGLAAAAICLASPVGAQAALGARGFSLSGSGNSLLSYDLTTPGTVTTTPITNVTAGDVLVGVAVRPMTGDLYAVGINSTADTATVYHVGSRTGFAAQVGNAAVFVNAGGSTFDLPSGRYAIAFNPATDRIRVVGAAGTNFRLNPNTGGALDGDLGGGAGTVTGINTDGAITGDPSITAVGYVNRRQVISTTTLYTLSGQSDRLYIQSPPNTGAQTAATPLKLNGSPFDADDISGMDFTTDVAVVVNNAPATGKAYATIVKGGETDLATVDLTSGEITVVGKVGDGSAVVRGLTIQGEEVAGGLPALGLATGGPIKRFNTATPSTVSVFGPLTPTPGEVLVGIARRAQTGQILGLGVNATANTATLYIVDPMIGTLTAIGTPGVIAFTQPDGSTPTDLPDPATVGWGFDVNPTVDRVRVVTSSGLNFRVNPLTGAPVDGDAGGAAGSIAGLNTDGTINGLPGGSTGVNAVAYTNAFAQPLTGAGVTTLYTLDPISNSLFIQVPANLGTQTTQKTVTLGGTPVDFDQRSGFDIPSDLAVTSSGTPATGSAFAALTVAGTASLYTIDLTTGAATLLGAIASAGPLNSLVIGERPPAPAPPVTPPATTPPATTPEATTPATTPPATSPPVDLAPTLTELTISPKRFRTGKAPKGVSKKIKTGTTITLSLTETATITLTVEKVETGRKSGATCKKPTTKNRKAKKCDRFTKVGTFTAAGVAGTNSVKFSGKLGKKPLANAKYRLTAIAVDAAKQSSAAATATFQVVR